MTFDPKKLATAPWYVGPKNDDGWKGPPGEIAIMADIRAGTPVGPKDMLAVRDGRMCVAVVSPIPDEKKDLYPELTRLHADFIVLARNALDVMMRRRWMPYKKPAPLGWTVVNERMCCPVPGTVPDAADPFTALVEADRWMATQETS